jgi:large subunit ribosomal protein L15
MKLNELRNDRLNRQARKRVGRGMASGTGKTSGRGHKGQKSRAGATINGFEGGQMPIYRRVPKRGFTNIFRTEFQVVNVAQLQDFVEAKKIDSSKPVTLDVMHKAGLLRRLGQPVKLLGKGEVKVALNLEVCAASKSAVELIEKAGGSVKILSSQKKKTTTKKAKAA